MHLIVLDANEYIFSFGIARKPESEELLNIIAGRLEDFTLNICRPILEEIERHLLPRHLTEVYGLLRDMGIEITERWEIPFEFVERYLESGLKRGDAFVVGYTEWVGAEFLISENRKDIVDHPELFPFKVMTAAVFLEKHTR